jgi:glycerol kinase
MAPADLILAVDQGTGSTKALLVDRRGAVLARASHAVRQAHPRPGWVEQSADEIWASVQTAVGRCLAGVDGNAVVAVGISNQRESMVLWDRATGEAVTPVISWQDQRTAAQCAALAEEGAGEIVRAISGLPLDPMFSAAKGRWLLDHADPDRVRSRRGELCLGTIDSWLLSRFGGEHLIEIGNASRTQLLDVRTGRWSPRLLDLFGVPEQVLPRVVPSIGPFPRVRGLSPLPDGVPVAAVLGDSHAALFAHAGWRPRQVKATYGTGSSVMARCDLDAAGAGPIAAAGLCLTIGWASGEIAYAVEGNIRASGSTLSWLADVVGRTPAELASLAATAHSDGVHLVPAFNGLGAPWWDARAQATLVGMSLATTLPAIARAALESVAFQVEDVMAAVDDVIGRAGVLQADGGATQDAALMQSQADLSGRRVHRSRVADLSALGAAHLAGRAIGLWSSAELDAVDRPFDSFEPRTTPAERSEARAAWHAAVARSRFESS